MCDLFKMTQKTPLIINELQKDCLICNQQVVGSSPTAGSIDFQGVMTEMAVRV